MNNTKSYKCGSDICKSHNGADFEKDVPKPDKSRVLDGKEHCMCNNEMQFRNDSVHVGKTLEQTTTFETYNSIDNATTTQKQF